VAEARGGVDDARRINGAVTARKVSRLGFQFVEGGGRGAPAVEGWGQWGTGEVVGVPPRPQVTGGAGGGGAIGGDVVTKTVQFHHFLLFS
jgi:hypothetical protein